MTTDCCEIIIEEEVTDIIIEDATYIVATGSGGSGESLVKTYTQASHGFVVNDCLIHNGAAWVKGLADDAATASAIGVVSAVPTANSFTITLGGVLTTAGLTAGDYFLSDVTAGLLTQTEPTTATHVSKPIMTAISSTEAIVSIERGIVIGSSSGFARSINAISTNTTAGSAANTDYVYLVSGNTTLTMPAAAGNTNRYTIKKIGTGTTMTIGATVDGTTNPTITVENTSLDLISSGTNWNVV